MASLYDPPTMDRSGRVFLSGTNTNSDWTDTDTDTDTPPVERPYSSLSEDDVSLKLHEAAQADPDFVDVVLAAKQYSIPSKIIDRVGVERPDAPRQVFSLGSGLTSEVIQHVITDQEAQANLPPNTTIALKIFSSARLASSNKAKAARQKVYGSILREMKTFSHPSLSSHPNILKLLFVGWSPHHTYPILAMELGDYGSLDYIIRAWGPGPTTRQKRHITIDIALGIQAIHQAGFIHGDLKPDNIIVFRHEDPARRLVAKITDFGGSDDAGKPAHLTPLWCAPEVLNEDPDLDWKRADVYSYGLVVASLWASGEGNWKHDERLSSSVLSKEDVDGLKYIKSLPEEHSSSLMSFLVKRITKDSLPTDIDPSEIFAILTPTLRTSFRERASTDDLMVIISDFSRAVSRAIEPRVGEGSFEIYEPTTVRPFLFFEVYIGTSPDYRAIISKQVACALDDINDRMKYIPQPEDIPDNLPKNLSTDQFLANLLATTENYLSKLYEAMEVDSKGNPWPGVIDFIKKGYFLFYLGYHGLYSLEASPVPDLKERALENLRESSLHDIGPASTYATFWSTGSQHESEIPVRLNLTLFALAGFPLAAERLHSYCPDLYTMVSKVIRERGLGCHDKVNGMRPTLYGSQKIASIYYSQAPQVDPAELTTFTLRDALKIGATDVVREILEDSENDAIPADLEQTIPGLLHAFSNLVDSEAAALARVAYNRGARLDYLLPLEGNKMPMAVDIEEPRTPLSAALLRGQPTFAFAIFCIHVEFNVPITQFSTALLLSFVNLYPEVGEALLQLFQDNPEMCVEIDEDIDLSRKEENAMALALTHVLAKVTSLLHDEILLLHGGEYEAAYERTLRVLLEEGADPTLGDPGTTALGSSILSDDIIALKLYIEHIEDRARKEGHKDEDVNDILLAHLKDPWNLKYWTQATSSPFENTFTALSSCIRYSSLRCFEFLLGRFPNLATVEVDEWGKTLLHRVCSGVDRLGPELDNNDGSPATMSLILQAGSPGGPGVKFVDLLLKAGADVMAIDMSGSTPLYWALLRANIPAADSIAAHCSQEQLEHLLRRDPCTGESIFEYLIFADVSQYPINVHEQRQPRLVESLRWLERRGAVYFHGQGGRPVWTLLFTRNLRTLRYDELMDAALLEYLVDLPSFTEKLRTERYNGFPLLHWAVLNSNVEMVRLLLNRNFDPNVVEDCTPNVATPLDCIPLLIAHGPPSRSGGMAMTSQADFRRWQTNLLDITNLLLDNGAKSAFFDVVQWITNGVNYLNDAGDNSNSSESRERAANLHQFQDPERTTELLKQQATQREWPKPLPPDDNDNAAVAATSMPRDVQTDVYLFRQIVLDGFRRLKERRQGQVESRKLLLLEEFHAEIVRPRLPRRDSGESSSGNVWSSELSREENCLDDNANNGPGNGNTKLHLAVMNRDISELMDALHDSSDDVDMENHNGYSPLDLAIRLKPAQDDSDTTHLEKVRVAVQLLLQAGADPNRMASSSSSQCLHPPLHACILRHDDPDLVEILIAAGADVNMLNRENLSPLMLATALGRQATLDFLFSTDVDVTQSMRPARPVHLSCER